MRKQVKVKPNSKTQKLVEEADGSLTVYLKSSPVDGKANAELILFLSKSFNVPKSAIAIKLGLKTSRKLVEILTHDS